MAWTSYQIGLAITMVVTGSINTLSNKWADTLSAPGKDGRTHSFVHPFVQACFMFLGELLCLLVFKVLYFYYARRRDGSEDRNHLVKGNRHFNPFVLFVPAMCDMIATSIMYVGLALTFASSFQMLRGSVIIFVGVLSVAFLDRTLIGREWSGIAFVIAGLSVVGAADFLSSDDGADNYSRNNIITGDLLIILAQIITAVQMVYEERYVAGMDIPALQAVGWEGLFGFGALGVLLVPAYYVHVPAPFNVGPTGSLEDAWDALVQIDGSGQLMLALGGTVFSIAFFNFAGISVTKEMSATTRMVLDSVRTLVIWLVSLQLHWQQFHALQLLGFGALIFGMCLYNNVLVSSVLLWCRDCRLRSRRYDELDEESGAGATQAEGNAQPVRSRPADEEPIA